MRIRQGIVLILLMTTAYCSADTLRLTPQGQWQDLSNDPQGKYILSMAEVKQKLASGSKGEALDALQALKADYKDLAGPDLDAYIEAETLFAEQNWSKATKQFQKFVKDWPESPFFDSANDRLYSIGTAFLNGQKRQVLWILWLPAFDVGVEIMHDIADRMGTGPMGLRALVTLAEAYEKKKQNAEAYEVWSEIADKWPTGDVGQQALLRMAQNLHAAYRGPHYDPTWLVSARAYYEDFLKRYPLTANQINVKDTIELIVEQQAYKNYYIADFYDRTDRRLAANLYYQYVLDTWPDSRAAELSRPTQEAGYVYPKTVSRKVFDKGCVFLDTWFGVGYLFGARAQD